MSNSLVQLSPAAYSHNGNGSGSVKLATKSAAPSGKKMPAPNPAPPPLNEDTVAAILKGRGLSGWLHVMRVVRVLGLFTLYIFLDTYDIRAAFNRRMVDRLSDEAAAKNWRAKLKTGYRQFLNFIVDRAIRLVRLIVFRGHEGSDKKL